MLSRAFGSLAKHQSKRPLDLPVHASTALRRAFGSPVMQQQTKSPLLDLSAKGSSAFRRCSHILQQVHQLHHQPARPDSLPQEQQPLQNSTSRGTPSACISEPNGTVEGSFDQRFEALISIGECVSDYELTLLLKKKPVPTCYVLCDPSPWMQLTQVDIWLLGMDQHGANMLAREYCNLMQSKNTPIALFHYPEWEEWENVRWSIFMEDDEEDVSRKIENALCPEKFTEGNPCSEYIKYIILPWFGKFEVLRKEENGGNIIFLSMEEFIADYESGALHPADVKQALVKAVNMLLQVVRDRFRSNAEPIKLAKAIEIQLESTFM